MEKQEGTLSGGTSCFYNQMVFLRRFAHGLKQGEGGLVLFGSRMIKHIW